MKQVDSETTGQSEHSSRSPIVTGSDSPVREAVTLAQVPNRAPSKDDGRQGEVAPPKNSESRKPVPHP